MVLMEQLRTRPMTQAEFESFRVGMVRDYAAEHVAAGDWTAEEAERRASDDTDALLPEGVGTPGVLLLVAETPDGRVVGHLWVGLERNVGRGDGAWIYDIEIVPEHRGRGFGRALLAVAEYEVATRGDRRDRTQRVRREYGRSRSLRISRLRHRDDAAAEGTPPRSGGASIRLGAACPEQGGGTELDGPAAGVKVAARQHVFTPPRSTGAPRGRPAPDPLCASHH